MADRLSLKRELMELIAVHKEGFAAGTPAAQRIDALIDELTPLTPYPRALDHPDKFKGHWKGSFFNLGKLVGGAEAMNQGVGKTMSLKVYSMGRLPDIPATLLGSGLEIDPATGAYNFVSHYTVGVNKVPVYHCALANFERREENPDRFFVEFSAFKVVPTDASMTPEQFAAAVGADNAAQMSAELNPRPKLWSHVVYMDDDIRIQLGQLGGHYVLTRTDLPMYSIEYWKDKRIAPPPLAAE